MIWAKKKSKAGHKDKELQSCWEVRQGGSLSDNSLQAVNAWEQETSEEVNCKSSGWTRWWLTVMAMC